MIDKFCKTCGEPFLGDGRRKYCDNCSPAITLYMRQYEKSAETKNKKAIADKKYSAKNREKLNKQGRDRRWQERLQAIKHYGGVCICCGETEPKFLTLHHANGDGKEHRLELVGKSVNGAGVIFYRRLRQLGYPKDILLEVLCWNCHMAKDKYGECPHKAV